MQPDEEYRKETASPSSISAAIGEGPSREGVDENCFRYKMIYCASGNTRADLGSFAEFLELRCSCLEKPLPTALGRSRHHRGSQEILGVTGE